MLHHRGMDIRELFEHGDIAQLIRRSTATVRRDAEHELLQPVARTRRGVLLYDRAAIDAYLARRAQRQRSAA